MPNVPPVTTATAPSAAVPAAAPGGVTPVEVAVGSVPDKILQLLRQIQVSGTVTQVDDGALILNTVLGKLTLLLPQLADIQQQKTLQQLITILQNQRPLTVVIQPGDPPTQAFLLLPQATAPPASPQIPLPPGGLPQGVFIQPVPLALPPLTPGVTLTAVVLPPDITLSASGPAPPSQIPAAALQISLPEAPIGQPAIAPVPDPAAPVVNPSIELQNIAAPTQQTQQNPPSPPAPAIPAQIFSNISTTALAAQTLLPVTAATAQATAVSILLQPGNEVALRVDAIIPPPAPNIATAAQSQTLPTPGPNQILATVIGNGPNGQLILKAGDATLYVRQSASIPVGSNLLVTVEPAQIAVPVTLPVFDTQNFAALPQALAALAQIDPQLARQVLQNAIPQPNAALPGTLLFLLSAFKQGDLRNWLGNDAVDTLTRLGKLDLIGKLTQELNTAGQPAHDAVVGEWRSYSLPLHNNGQFQVLDFYVHRDAQKQGGREAASRPGAAQVRFLIDMRMSRLGALQLDGFVQPKKLDLIVRSETALPGELPRELRASYLKIMDATGYVGSINFQVGRRHWLIPQKTTSTATMVT